MHFGTYRGGPVVPLGQFQAGFGTDFGTQPQGDDSSSGGTVAGLSNPSHAEANNGNGIEKLFQCQSKSQELPLSHPN